MDTAVARRAGHVSASSCVWWRPHIGPHAPLHAGAVRCKIIRCADGYCLRRIVCCVQEMAFLPYAVLRVVLRTSSFDTG
eukprot:2571344-Amphidinium_carterae.1